MRIDDAISIASKTKSNEDYEDFLTLAHDLEFFFNYEEFDENMTVPLADVGDCLQAVLFFTNRDTASRSGRVAGITWEKALEMVLKIPEADGLVIANSQNSWIAFSKERIHGIKNGP